MPCQIFAEAFCLSFGLGEFAVARPPEFRGGLHLLFADRGDRRRRFLGVTPLYLQLVLFFHERLKHFQIAGF